MEKDKIKEIKKNKKTTNYDGIVKQIINNMQTDKIIQFLGNLFEKNYTSESKLIKLNSETQNIDNERRISDLYLKVDDDFFNIEIQSTDDQTMAMRIFEYGMRGALAHGRTYSEDFSKLTLDIPEPVVIYLRKTGNTPDKFTIEFNFPDKAEAVAYEAKVKFVEDYSIDDMIQKQLYPMMPFYPMRYEKIINAIHEPQLEDAINSDMINVIRKLKPLITERKIEPGDLSYIVDSIAVVYENMMLRSKNVNKEKVGATMEMIQQETVTFFDIYDAKEEWKAEGKDEMAMKLMESGVALDIIQKCSGLDDVGMAKLISKYNDLKGTDVTIK